MCVRCFIRLLVLSVIIISRNQACSHCTSKHLASANPKYALSSKSMPGKDLGVSYQKKYADNGKYLTGSKSPYAKLSRVNSDLDYEHDDLRGMRRESVVGRKRSSTEWSGYGSNEAHYDSFSSAKKLQKSRSGGDSGIGIDKIRSYLLEQQKNRLGPVSVETSREKTSPYVGADRNRDHSYWETSRSRTEANPDRIASNLEPVKVGQKKSGYGTVDQMGSRTQMSKDKNFKITFADSEEYQPPVKNKQYQNGFDQGLGQKKYRISEGSDEQDENILQTLGEKEYKGYRKSDVMEKGTLGKSSRQYESKQRQLEAELSKELNYRKSLVDEPIEREDTFEDNILGAIPKKSTAVPLEDVDDYLTDSEAENILDNLEYDPHDVRSPNEHLPVRESKGSSEINYRDFLQQVEKVYKILRNSVAREAKNSDDPDPYISSPGNRVNLPYSKDQLETQSLQSSVSKRPTGDKRRGNYYDYELEEYPDKPKKLGSDWEAGSGSDFRKQGDIRNSRPYPESYYSNPETDTDLRYTNSNYRKSEVSREPPVIKSSKRRPVAQEYSRPRAEYSSQRSPKYSTNPESLQATGLSRQVATGKEYSESDYPEHTRRGYPHQDNLASPRCKFEDLNPSKEAVSDEEDRNIQFRSSQRKSGNKAGTYDLGATGNQNINKNVNAARQDQNIAEESLKPAMYEGQLNEMTEPTRVGNSKQDRNSPDSNTKSENVYGITGSKSPVDATSNIHSEPNEKMSYSPTDKKATGETLNQGDYSQTASDITAHPRISSNLDDSKLTEIQSSLKADWEEITGEAQCKTGTCAKSKAVVTPDQFQDGKTEKNETEGESETGASDKAGCGDLFRCLAEMGQTWITQNKPETETKATDEVGAVKRVLQTSPVIGTRNEAPNSHGFARDAASGGTSDVSLIGSPNAAKASASNYVQDHPFYELVTSIIDAAQEATKRRLVEEKRAKLTYHPEKTVQAPHVPTESQRPPEFPSAAQKVGVGMKLASAPGNKKSVGKSIPSVGSGKGATSEKRMIGNGKTKNIIGNPKLGKSGAVGNDFWSKLKMSVPQKSSNVAQGKKSVKPEITGKAKSVGSSGPSKDTGPSSKSDKNVGKVGAVRKVTFTPVSLKAPVTQVTAAPTSSPKVEQKSQADSNAQSQRNDPKTVGVPSKSRSPVSKVQNASPTTSSSGSNVKRYPASG
nr:PREDICTED: uncharacterized protein LOC109043667 [Bemisia tabaci]